MKPVQRTISHFFTGLIVFDVGIVGDRIEAVGRLGRERAERRINAEGHVVAPGFIDIHSHSDNSLLVTVTPRRIGVDDRGSRKTLEIQP